MTRWQTVGLLVLCLWSSVTWLTGDVLPALMQPMAGQGLRLTLAGFLILLVLRPVGVPARNRVGQVVTAGVGLIGLPFILLTAAQGRVASTTGVLVFAMMPIVSTVIGAASSGDADGLRLLPYGLLGVAGILILLPVRLPVGGFGFLGVCLLLLAMLSTGSSMIWLHGLLKEFPVGWAMVSICLGNGALLTALSIVSIRSNWSLEAMGMESLRCLLVDLPETVLLIWLLKAIAPQRLSVRYVIAPLFAVLEGMILMRPHVEVRTLLGQALLGIAAYQLLWAKSSTEEISLKLGQAR